MTLKSVLLCSGLVCFVCCNTAAYARRVNTGEGGNNPAVAPEGGAPSNAPRLKGTVQTSNYSSRFLFNAPIEVIDQNFIGYSSTGGHELHSEIPRDMLRVYNDGNGWSHYYGPGAVESVPYPDWACWFGGINDAMYQLRWELVTDPEQKVRKLGRYYLTAPGTGSSLWNTTATARPGIEITDMPMAESGLFLPALSYKTYFKGKIRTLVQVDSKKVVSSRVLESTLTPQVTQRVKESIEALSGHPLLDFPNKKYESMAIIFNFEFNHPQQFLRATNARDKPAVKN